MNTRAIVAAILIAGFSIAAAIFFRPAPDRYTFKVVGDEIQRFDAVTGEVLVTGRGQTHRVHEREGRLVIE